MLPASSPDSACGHDVELLRQVGDLHVGARLDHLAAIRLQLARDDLQLRRLASSIHTWEHKKFKAGRHRVRC